MKRLVMGIVWSLWVSPLLALPLTSEDVQALRTYEINQSIMMERYEITDNGPASTFGYNLDAYLWPNHFVGLAIFGAVGGGRGGYGIAALSAGQRMRLPGRWEGDMRLSVGSGGGGGVKAGGGFSIQPAITARYPISESVLGFLRGGYLTFPSGSFSSPTLAFGLVVRYNGVFLPF